MKKSCMLFCYLLVAGISFAQYIGVRAKYTETRLVDDNPSPPKRENRLVLSFFEVSASGNYTPAILSNYDIWILKKGLQYGNVMGGVVDSTGNNYPGYQWTAPMAVSYYNTLGQNYIDCDPDAATHYVVNGHTLDCGFVTVSYWDVDGGTGLPFEVFPAPNICLPYYEMPHPYYWSPGNLNFNWPSFPGPPYNWYNFSCGGPQQLVIRGVLASDTGSGLGPLPVRFANVRGFIEFDDRATICWTNLTESEIQYYNVEKSTGTGGWHSIETMLPDKNDGGQASYNFQFIQHEEIAMYRIKATEMNGDAFYSPVIALKKNSNIPEVGSTLSIYPNPVTGSTFNFKLLNAAAGRYISCIITPDGKQVKQKMIEHNGGDLSRQIEISSLPPGVYRLLLRSATQKYTETFHYGY